MGRYADWLTTVDVCKMELEELEGICARYHVLSEDVDTLKSMVKGAYYQLTQAFVSARAMERIIRELDVLDDAEYFKRYMHYLYEEELRYPFDVNDEGEEAERE